MLKSIKKLAVIAAVALVSGQALAVPVTWNYSGACTAGDCSKVPTITGTLNGDASKYGDSDELGQLFYFGEVSSYSFTLGGNTYSGSNALGAYDLDAAGNIIGGSMQFFGDFFQLDLSVGAFSWYFFDENGFGHRDDVEVWGKGSYSSTSVPEPAILSLLGLGLLSLGFARRRKI